MKKISFLSFMFFIGCGQTFDPWIDHQKTNGTGGNGGTIATVITTTSNTQNTNTGGMGGNGSTTTETIIPEKIEIHQDCADSIVLIPPQSAKDVPVVSCYAPLPEEYPKTIVGFEYATWGGVYDVYGCEKNDQVAAWFIDMDNFSHDLSDLALINEKIFPTDSLNWFDATIGQSTGPMAYVQVMLDNPIVLQFYPQIFCFGRRLTFTDAGKPDCPVGCFSNYEMHRHQWATNSSSPYEFKAINDIPDPGLGPEINLYSVIYLQ